MLCGSHWQSTVPALTSWFSSTSRMAPAGTSYFSSSRPLGSNTWISPLRVSTTCWPASLRTTFSRVNLTTPAFLARISLLRRSTAADAADVERTHRQLRARLADALGGDDADGHAFLDHRAGGKIHAVAQPADAQRGVAGHRAADLNLFQAQFLDAAGDRRA